MQTLTYLQSAVSAYLWLSIGVILGAAFVILIQANGPDDPDSHA